MFRDELDLLAKHRGVIVHYLLGSRRDDPSRADPLGPRSIAAMVPDVADRDVFLCGPDTMMQSVAATIVGLGVPAERVHRERFDA